MTTALPITRDPRIMVGKPCVAGTRITVEYILERLEDGDTIDVIVAAHQNLARAGVEAAIAYAREAVSKDRLDNAAR